MNPWPILGDWAARDNNDDDDEDSAETRGHWGHGRGHEIQSIGSVSFSHYYHLRENRMREGKERKKVKRGDVKFFREILFEVLINN